MELVLNGRKPFSWGGAWTGDHLTDPVELGNLEPQKGRQPGRARFTDEEIEGIRAGRCFICKEKCFQARN